MIEFNSIEEIDHIFEQLKTKNKFTNKELQRLRKAFISNVSIIENKDKKQTLENLQHELAELGEENDMLTQELALSRKSLCKELENEYKDKYKKDDIAKSLKPIIYEDNEDKSEFEKTSIDNSMVLGILNEIKNERKELGNLESVIKSMKINRNQKSHNITSKAINYFKNQS